MNLDVTSIAENPPRLLVFFVLLLVASACPRCSCIGRSCRACGVQLMPSRRPRYRCSWRSPTSAPGTVRCCRRTPWPPWGLRLVGRGVPLDHGAVAAACAEGRARHGHLRGVRTAPMELNLTEDDRLLVFTAAQLARATLGRGLAAERSRGDRPSLRRAAHGGSRRTRLRGGRRHRPAEAADTLVLEGVEAIVPEIRIRPCSMRARARSCPRPVGPADAEAPGGARFGAGDVPLVLGRERRWITVRNAGRRPVRVSSHFPFWQTNPYRVRPGGRAWFPPRSAGRRPPRWAPGQEREVGLVAYAGLRGTRA